MGHKSELPPLVGLCCHNLDENFLFITKTEVLGRKRKLGKKRVLGKRILTSYMKAELKARFNCKTLNRET